eukprot:scaffold566_cov364-Pavlova_lutheri.AAC.5
MAIDGDRAWGHEGSLHCGSTEERNGPCSKETDPQALRIQSVGPRPRGRPNEVKRPGTPHGTWTNAFLVLRRKQQDVGKVRRCRTTHATNASNPLGTR